MLYPAELRVRVSSVLSVLELRNNLRQLALAISCVVLLDNTTCYVAIKDAEDLVQSLARYCYVCSRTDSLDGLAHELAVTAVVKLACARLTDALLCRFVVCHIIVAMPHRGFVEIEVSHKYTGLPPYGQVPHGFPVPDAVVLCHESL